ncbi:MAG: ABC transporter ATP-binding protein [Lachnospiraceae bacterium]|nr:ABC transporter ATP-binding protein [Lachnospiraceae bacterium]
MLENKNEEERKNEPIKKEYSLWSNLGMIFGHMLHCHKVLYIIIPMGILITPVMSYLWTFLSKIVIEYIMAEKELQDMLLLVGIFFSIQAASTCLNTFYWSMNWYRYIATRMDFMIQLNRKVMTMKFEYLENPKVMDAFKKAQNACGNNDDGVEGMMRTGVDAMANLAVVIVGVLIMGTLNPWIILLLTITSFLSFISNDRANAYTKRTVWDVLANWSRKNDYMMNVTTDFSAAKDIRMFSLSKWLLNKKGKLDEYRYELQKKHERVWCLVGLLDNLTWALSQIGVYAIIIYEVLQGGVTVANAFLYVSTATTFYQYVNTVLKNLASLRKMSRQVCDFRSFLDFGEGQETEEGMKSVPHSEQYEFQFENVSFRYPNAEKYALRDLNITLAGGERLAVVGLNGAGKSTFIKLLLRLYEPTEGRILLNGTDIREYDRESYFNLFAPVFQEVYQFAFPLVENVSMAPPKLTDEKRADRCLDMAGLKEKVASLPKGIHTEMLKIIEDDGLDFSGGEKQKLALARALYKDAAIIVLDEPTAALDALAEYELYQNFDSMIGNKTAVYISHRLSSTRFCQHIAMFVGGKMVEYGTHDSLMDANGAYAEMFHVQAQYYTD